MSFAPGESVLGDRYRLTRHLATDSESQAWLAENDRFEQYLVKLWPFSGPQPDAYQRALWDYQLRLLYRLCSSPHAEDALILLRDAGVDTATMAFVMALQSDGYDTLETTLGRRPDLPWLQTTDEPARAALWAALGRLAAGLNLLHSQRILHRNLTAEAVYIDEVIGPRSLRLGGFEWSIRLGDPLRAVPAAWAPPPELLGAIPRFSPETDWFSFGILAARLLLDLSRVGGIPQDQRHNAVVNAVRKATPRQLTERERLFLLSLLDSDPTLRTLGEEVPAAIDDILEVLRGVPQTASASQQSLILTVNLNPLASKRLIEHITNLGFRPNPDDHAEPFTPTKLVHSSRIKEFLRRDFSNAAIYAVPRADFFLLEGLELCIMIRPFKDGAGRATWNAAFCYGPADLRAKHTSADDIRELPEGVVAVLELRETHDKLSSGRGFQSWDTFLPRAPRAASLMQSLLDFQNFLRCTHQMELLLRSEEVFRYELVGDPDYTAARVRLRLRQAGVSMLIPSFFQTRPQLYAFIQREVASGRPGSRLLHFSQETKGEVFPARRPDDKDIWQIEDFEPDDEIIVVSRDSSSAVSLPPTTGLVRTSGFGGQMALIMRRDAAIARLRYHAYLLRSLTNPGSQFMDIGPLPALPVEISTDEMDKSKQAVLRDILRTRPVYVLQGPPGTGKTTLVKYLLRQIFFDDPEAQVLITAQAHGAVDVLRERVHELFATAEWSPLSVRLGGRGRDEEELLEGSVEWTSRHVLAATLVRLRAAAPSDQIGTAWLKTVEQLLADIDAGTSTGEIAEFFELVKRSANITYCTTSAGDLDILAASQQSYDWSIVEEAGKAHGFDLALPLQAGHRWLLIGDHHQLEAYGFENFQQGVKRLPEAVEALESLPDPGSLLDREWIKSWYDLEPDDRERFERMVEMRLPTFEYLWNLCREFTGTSLFTEEESVGALAGRLTRQHRMHPRIAQLISDAYYEHGLFSETEQDGRPIAAVLHGIESPPYVGDRAVVWLDLPWALNDFSYTERGRRRGELPYSNPAEVDAIRAFLFSLKLKPTAEVLDLAILAPYNQQVRELNSRLGNLALPGGLRLKKPLAARTPLQTRLAYTVDGFQGNEADIVLISLVRNNTADPGTGLGFLAERPRANVLLSRAERLLVLVGSWDFFTHQLSTTFLEDRRSDLWHWKQVLNTLSLGFQDGWAARVPARRDL